MALAGSAHAESSVHVHVVTGHIQADETLEDDGPAGPSRAEEDQKTRGSAAIGDHVQHCTESGGLVEVSCCITVQAVQQTGHRVEEGTGPGVEGHVVQRGEGQKDPGISWERVKPDANFRLEATSAGYSTDKIRSEKEDILLGFLGFFP